MEQNNLDKIHSVEKNLLVVFDQLCKDNNLRYFICGGTLLGAVRHKGFIPWDDDVDVMMPRQDYEKFKKIQKQFPNYVSLMKTDIIHIFDNRTEIYFDHILGDHEKYGIMIDIFPLDGQPESELKLKIHEKKVLFYQMFIRFSNINKIKPSKKRSITDNFIINIGRTLKFNKFVKKQNWVRRAHKELSKYDYDKSKLAGALLGSFRSKEVMPKNIFGKGKRIYFDGIYLNAPEKPEDYLTRLYGNYKELPPVSERGKHHTMRIYKL